MRKAWDVTMTEGSCIDVLSMFKATATLSILTDLVILVLPFPLVIKLHMKTLQKIGIIFVFVIGSVSVALHSIAGLKCPPAERS